MEVGAEVDRRFDTAGNVVSSSRPGDRIAHATHTTGCEDLRNTYKALREWCEANGPERAGIEWEVYSDPDHFDH